MNRYQHLAALCVALSTPLSTPALAAEPDFCSILGTAFIVGDIASDSACTHNDIQSAINGVTCPNTTIYVTQGHLYQAQHLLIQDTNVTIEGTDASDCTAFVNAGGNNTPPPQNQPIIISGSGHTGDSVISVQGNSNVTLAYLQISDGRSDRDQFGGGVYVSGNGSLTLSNDFVTGNFAGNGGGININGDPGPLAVTLNLNTVVSLNTAQYDGGGIRIEGNADLILQEPASVLFNKALSEIDSGVVVGGNGGGIAVFGPAQADIAGGAFSVLDNTALYGGGIAVLGKDPTDGNFGAEVRVYSVVGDQATSVSNNTATVEGGGVYIRGKETAFSESTANFCASSFAIDSNSAPEGAAIYLDHDTLAGLAVADSFMYFNQDSCNQGLPLTAVDCNSGIACNEIVNNTASSGSVIFLNQDAEVDAARFSMRNNSGDRMITAFSTATEVGFTSFNNCLIADNHSAHEVIHSETEDEVSTNLTSCTVANNTIDNGFVFFAQAGFHLSNSIIWQPGESTIDYLANGCSNCEATLNVVSNDVSTFPVGATGVQAIADPLFIDAAHGNYHLNAFVQDGVVNASPALDYAVAIGGTDLDGNPRDLDIPLVDHGGVRDLGAYEAQPIPDRIFGDAFGDPLSLLQ